ncbi:uncharacterized protein LOC109853495 [Pseudomyrmex gracilis]|uniref:uncharacterized protein LOC109853495 n=1 Tax=Pseudomyrmex gracilis TaxID=219809 RepID=UPI0009953F5D|nr:uncharacterized protein LOC109853495 [Pseudomyrmex gracilis]
MSRMTGKGDVRKKKKRVRPMKVAALVVSAIQDLRETKGSTSKQITGYISYASSLPEQRVKRQVNAALKRGVKYGILRRYRGRYFLPTGDELDRANRIAMRFARLSMPSPLLAKINSVRVKDRKRLRRIVNGKRNSKKVSKTHHSPSVSVNPNLVDKLVNDVVVV